MPVLQPQVIAGLGVSEEEADAELAERLLEVERLQLQGEGVSAVLLLSAQAELARLREELAAATAAAAAPAAAEVRMHAWCPACKYGCSQCGHQHLPHVATPRCFADVCQRSLSLSGTEDCGMQQ